MDSCDKYKKGEPGIQGMTVQELKDLLSNNNIDSVGKRLDVCKRILDHNLLINPPKDKTPPSKTSPAAPIDPNYENMKLDDLKKECIKQGYNKSECRKNKKERLLMLKQTPKTLEKPSSPKFKPPRPATPKSKTPPRPATPKSKTPPIEMQHPTLEITKYSEKSFVVRGNEYTGQEFNDLQDLKGSYNKFLKGGKGFIFSNTRLEEVEKYLKTGELPEGKKVVGALHIENYKFVVKNFTTDQRNELVALGGTYSARMKGGSGVIFDESEKHVVESYIKDENK